MRTLLLTIFVTSNLLTIAPSFAKATGNSSGGGGDALEIRVNEIREDILDWILDGGAKSLDLPNDLPYKVYFESMTNVLQPKKVVISFTKEKILVNNVEKTCKGFFPDDITHPHIRCNISRFKDTPDSEQYKLIHHEHAGLVDLEQNEDAASDYSISEQITDYLVEQKVLKLAIKQPKEFYRCMAIVARKKESSLTSEQMDLMDKFANSIIMETVTSKESKSTNKKFNKLQEEIETLHEAATLYKEKHLDFLKNKYKKLYPEYDGGCDSLPMQAPVLLYGKEVNLWD